MKILKSVNNLSSIAPIGGQYPKEMTESGEGLSHDVSVNTETNILPSTKTDVSTLSFTDASTLFVENRTAVKKADASTNMNDIYHSIVGKKARAYAMSVGQLSVAVCGVAEANYADANGPFDTKMLEDDLTSYLGVSIESKGSTMLASFVNALENMNVKVQNAFNRPLPFNTWTSEERFAAMVNYHARVLQLIHIFDTISGMVSFTYDKSTSAAISTEGITSLYSPTLFAKMQEAYNSIKQFPILDTYSAAMIQKYTKLYSASEKVYFPGGYHQIVTYVPCGNSQGTIGSGVNQMKFDEKSCIGLQSSGYLGRTTTGGIHNWIETGTIEEILEKFASVANAITIQFSKVIQFCIQCTAKGIYNFTAADEYIDFDNEGIYIYAVEKDYHINNFIRNIPLQLNYEDGSTNKTTVLSPISYVKPGVTKSRVFNGYNRYVNPYCLKDNIYTTYELLSAKVWEITDTADYYEDAVTGIGISCWTHGNAYNGVRVWYSVGSMIKFPLINSSATVLLPDANELTTQMIISEIDTNDRGVLVTSLARLSELVDQFDLLYLVLPTKSDAGSRDADFIISDLEEDAYFFELSQSALATPNADVYASFMNLVTWLESSNISRKTRPDKKSVDHSVSGGNKT